MEREVFAWIVRHLRWLARLPLIPHFFDMACFVWTTLFRPRRRAAMEVIEEEILERHRCELGTHRLGGTAFRWRGREIAHLHGIGLLDVQITRRRAEAFISETLAEPHHVLGHCAWVSLWIESIEDLPLAMRLVEAATETAEERSAQSIRTALRKVLVVEGGGSMTRSPQEYGLR
jgi:hypothetical protein